MYREYLLNISDYFSLLSKKEASFEFIPPFIIGIIAFIYSFIHGSNVWKYLFNKNVTVKGAFLKRTKLYINKNSSIVIGEKCQMNNCTISIAAGGDIFIAGNQTCINNTRFVVREHGRIAIKEDFSMQGGIIQSVDGMPVEIGAHCMFSGDIAILSGDLHPIFSIENRQIINPSQKVIISDNVWLGAHVKVMKGSFVASHSVVGCSSLVTGRLSYPNSIYAGVPAKHVRGECNWSRSRNEM